VFEAGKKERKKKERKGKEKEKTQSSCREQRLLGHFVLLVLILEPCCSSLVFALQEDGNCNAKEEEATKGAKNNSRDGAAADASFRGEHGGV